MKAKRFICLLLAASCLCVCCSASASSEDAGFCGVPFLDSRTVLVGDSLTCHLIAMFLRPYDLLNGASYMAAPNSAVNYYFEDWWPLKPLEQNGYGSETSAGLEGLTFRAYAGAGWRAAVCTAGPELPPETIPGNLTGPVSIS